MENGWVRYLKARYIEGAIEAEELDEQLADALAYDEYDPDNISVMPLEVLEWLNTHKRITDEPGGVIEVRGNPATMVNVNAVLKEMYAVAPGQLYE